MEKAADPQQGREWAQRFLRQQDIVSQSLVSARDIWTSIWTTGKADSPRGNQLLVLIEDANQILNSTVALTGLIVIGSSSPFFKHIQPETKQTIEQLAISLQRLATGLRKSRKSISLSDLAQNVEQLQHQWQTLRHQIGDRTIEVEAREYNELVSLSKIVRSLSELSEQIHADAEITTDLPLSFASQKKFILTQQVRASKIETLKNNFTFRSFAFRHALRLTMVVAIAASTVPITGGTPATDCLAITK